MLGIKKLTKRRNTQIPIGHLVVAVAAAAGRSCLPLSLPTLSFSILPIRHRLD